MEQMAAMQEPASGATKQTTFIKLFLLLIVLEKVVAVVTPTLTTQPTDWMRLTFVPVNYILIGIFILTTWDSLADYNIELFALLLFILLSTVLRINAAPLTTLEIILNVGTWIVSSIILFNILRLKTPVPAHKIGTFTWTVIGMVAGLLFALISIYFMTKVLGIRDTSGNPPGFPSVGFIRRVLQYLASNVDVQNEFIFRGMLLGYLVKTLKDEKKAYVLQALAFWVSGFTLAFSNPLEFWVILPLSTVLVSLLVWKSRSLAPSIMASTFFDTFYVIFLAVLGH
jgi:hypothetical protein